MLFKIPSLPFNLGLLFILHTFKMATTNNLEAYIQQRGVKQSQRRAELHAQYTAINKELREDSIGLQQASLTYPRCAFEVAASEQRLHDKVDLVNISGTDFLANRPSIESGDYEARERLCPRARKSTEPQIGYPRNFSSESLWGVDSICRSHSRRQCRSQGGGSSRGTLPKKFLFYLFGY